MDDLITKLAEDAGGQQTDLDGRMSDGNLVWLMGDDDLRRFAALVANECSTIVMSRQLPRGTEWCDVREEFAAAIRAKFKEPTNG